MKNKIFAFAVIGCMTVLFLAGCEKSSEQKAEGAKQELKDAKADYLAEWQKFKTESETQIKANEDRIKKMAEEAFKESGTAASSTGPSAPITRYEPMIGMLKTLYPQVTEKDLLSFLTKEGLTPNDLIKMDDIKLMGLFKKFLANQEGRR